MPELFGYRTLISISLSDMVSANEMSKMALKLLN